MSKLMIQARECFCNEKHDTARCSAMYNSKHYSVWYMVTLNGTDWQVAAHAPESFYALATFVGGRYSAMVLGALAVEPVECLPEPSKATDTPTANPAQFPPSNVQPSVALSNHKDAAAYRAAAELAHKKGWHKTAHDCLYQATVLGMRALGAYHGADV